MHVVHVHIHVKKDKIDEFIQATRENAQASIKELGVKRFDILQQDESPEFFLLQEIYINPAASASHKDTAHYKKWKNIVEDMMVEPRRSQRLKNIYPNDEEW
jgi:(4S)-4-hydroxy-5-phosphonooxypentane-2,3-dione isomerase